MSRQSDDRGYVLLIAIFVIIVIMAAAFLVAASIHRQRWMYRQERQDIVLTAMNDAAIAMALSRLWGDPDYTGTKEPYGEGTIKIEIREIDRRTVDVTVHGRYWGGGRSARAQVRIDRRPPSERDPPRVIAWEPIPTPPPDDETDDDTFREF